MRRHPAGRGQTGRGADDTAGTDLLVRLLLLARIVGAGLTSLAVDDSLDPDVLTW